MVYLRRLLLTGLIVLLGTAVAIAAQNQKPLPLQETVPGMGANHRLILKDGTYQIVRKYEIVGSRVRYISVERGGDWEELPVDLVDWDATRKWERDHANEADDSSPAMKEAEELDKEEAAARADQTARMPEVSEGLELPDADGVFVLDTYQGLPELVELNPTPLDMNARDRHGLSTLNPLAASRAHLELEGAHARAHLHVNDPTLYLSLDTVDKGDTIVTHAFTVNTGGAKQLANGKHGAQSASSGFAIVHLDERRAVRFVPPVHLNPTGTVTPSEDIIPVKVETLPGKHWLKVTPEKKLLIGEYLLVEILSPTDINQEVWDFGVNPAAGDNPASLGPIQK